jgi:hypothetical protein
VTRRLSCHRAKLSCHHRHRAIVPSRWHDPENWGQSRISGDKDLKTRDRNLNTGDRAGFLGTEPQKTRDKLRFSGDKDLKTRDRNLKIGDKPGHLPASCQAIVPLCQAGGTIGFCRRGPMPPSCPDSGHICRDHQSSHVLVVPGPMVCRPGQNPVETLNRY